MIRSLAGMRQRFDATLVRLTYLPRTLAGWRARKLGHLAAQRGDWPSAVAHYRTALAGNRHMVPIWLCLGHAQLQTGDAAAAAPSFGRAAELAPGNPAPFRDLARTAQSLGRADEAAARYLQAYERSRDVNDLCSFAASLPRDERRQELIDRARRDVPLFPRDAAATTPAPALLLLDISELLLWYRSFRLPSGVQRVQIGLIAALLATPGGNVVACRFDGGCWKTVGSDALLHLLALSEAGDRLDDPDWQSALLTTYLTISGNGPVDFAAGAVLVSLGSWVTTEFMDAVDAVKRRTDLKYIPLIYDLIPIFHPEWFPAGVAENFPQWLDRLAVTADAYMVISQSTKRDLLKVSDARGRRLDPSRVTVMALDADCRSRFAASDATDALGRYGLLPNEYVLVVGTIEPRKNHANALRAWRLLLDTRSAQAMPVLVFVGHGGWKNERVHRLLKKDRGLAAKTKILSGVPDGDLSVLYRFARFILYPSFYEGWGLPVTEALCYGKAVAAADNSSLPEAGGQFADYFDADDVRAIAAVAGRLIDDPAYLAERERQIADAFVPRAWRDLAADLERAAVTTRAG